MNTNKKDSGPAFPLGDFEWTSRRENNGMTLRDWFAGQALAGLMAHNGHGYSKGEISAWAYERADAMLKERSKNQ